MNKQEAIQAMQEGKKVTHPYFSPDEWVTIEGDLFVFEDGCKTRPHVFWKYRQGEDWEKDWSIYKD